MSTDEQKIISMVCTVSMAVTNTVRDEVVFDGKTKTWDRRVLTEDDVYDKLMKMKRKRKTALPFSTGVFIPAYVRAWVWEMIHDIDLDMVYCDTDSCKFTGDHHALFEKFNARVFEKHAQCAADLGIPLSALSPVDPKGVPHPIGVFDREDDAEWFCTCGAKRYAETVNGETWCTISGVQKQKLASIRDFYNGRFFNEKTSGKTIACYIEHQQPFDFIDHTGKAAHVEQEYAVNIRPTTYKLTISPEFMKFVTSTKLSIFEEDLPYETEILQSFSD